MRWALALCGLLVLDPRARAQEAPPAVLRKSLANGAVLLDPG